MKFLNKYFKLLLLFLVIFKKKVTHFRLKILLLLRSVKNLLAMDFTLYFNNNVKLGYQF